MICPFRALPAPPVRRGAASAHSPPFTISSSRAAASSSTSSRPAQDDIDETHGRWLEREPGIDERADWDTATRTFTLSRPRDGGETAMELAWVSPDEWRTLLQKSGFEIEVCYGWFDRRPYGGGEDWVWVARRPTV